MMRRINWNALLTNTSMSSVKREFQLNVREIEDEQNMRSNVSNTDFWNSIFAQTTVCLYFSLVQI